MDEKIDKRTKVYRDSKRSDTGDSDVRTDPVDVDILEQPSATEVLGNPPESPDNPPEKPDFSKVENNPGFSKCMKCGDDLELNDDGKVSRRVQPALCHACTWRNNG